MSSLATELQDVKNGAGLDGADSDSDSDGADSDDSDDSDDMRCGVDRVFVEVINNIK